MRYLVPFFLIALFAASAMLAPASFTYRMLFAAQLLGYGCALLAWLLEKVGIRSRLLALPQYFVLAADKLITGNQRRHIREHEILRQRKQTAADVASLIACYQFIRGERYARWE